MLEVTEKKTIAICQTHTAEKNRSNYYIGVVIQQSGTAQKMKQAVSVPSVSRVDNSVSRVENCENRQGNMQWNVEMAFSALTDQPTERENYKIFHRCPLAV